MIRMSPIPWSHHEHGYACGCLYIGDEAAWDNYRREQLQQNFLDQERMNAEMNENAAWNWGMWGPGWWAY